MLLRQSSLGPDLLTVLVLVGLLVAFLAAGGLLEWRKSRRARNDEEGC